MKTLLFFLLSFIYLTTNGQTYYIVRHAEKEQSSTDTVMSTPSDPALTKAGSERAQQLRDLLQDKHIRYIFSTNTVRTVSTAKPLSDITGIPIIIYKKPDQSFIDTLKALHENVLIVGHSNTVDDIVNGLTGTESVHGDLADTQYDNLYVVTIKGKKISFEALKYGQKSE